MSFLTKLSRLRNVLTRSKAASVNLVSAQVTVPDESAIEVPLDTRSRETRKREAPLLLILGRAGTGKTTLIRKLKLSPGKEQIILAFTGVAALNAGGQTIHSFFGIPLAVTPLDKLQVSRKLRDIAPHLERVIVDEISMVRPDLIDAMDHLLKRAKSNPRPFGGVQMLFVGDPLQLPPIVKRPERRALTLLGYTSFSPFAAKCITTLNFRVKYLEKVYRQNDSTFIDLLGYVRTGEARQDTVRTLNRMCYGDHKVADKPLIVTTLRKTADEYNSEGLAALPGRECSFTGLIEGVFNRAKEPLPVPLCILLKVDARVMTTRNDPGGRWVNGTLATVSRLSTKAIWIRIDGEDEEIEMQKHVWEEIDYEWNRDAARLESKVIGTFTQYALALAWASTVHKIQGCTLKSIRLDFKDGAFASGQTYVALSRATSLAGLSFARPLRVADIKWIIKLWRF